MIEFKSLHHISLTVSDLAKAKEFYGNILGLTEINRPPFDFPGAWYQIGNQQLHLIEDKEHQSLQNEEGINTRARHFAIRVGNYAETVAYLQKKQVEIVERPNSVSGFAQIFCQDPDGNIIEFHVDQNDLAVN